jgi:predicted RNase H-like nuclease (RuvC/YqgF family)
MGLQLDFFEAHDDISELKKQDDFLLERVDNLRRGLFKRHEMHQKSINSLLVMVEESKEEITKLKAEIESLRKFLIKEVK